MVKVWQQSSNVNNEGRLFDVEFPSPQASVSSPVLSHPRGYGLDCYYIETEFYKFLFYRRLKGGYEVTEDSDDSYGFGFVEVYSKWNGICPDMPDYVYIASTPHQYVELTIFLARSGGIRRLRAEEFEN